MTWQALGRAVAFQSPHDLTRVTGRFRKHAATPSLLVAKYFPATAPDFFVPVPCVNPGFAIASWL